jgi:hypothetical protein
MKLRFAPLRIAPQRWIITAAGRFTAMRRAFVQDTPANEASNNKGIFGRGLGLGMGATQ